MITVTLSWPEAEVLWCLFFFFPSKFYYKVIQVQPCALNFSRWDDHYDFALRGDSWQRLVIFG